MALTRSFFGVSEDDAYFNLEAATEAYERIMKMDNAEAKAMAAAIVFDGFTTDIERNKSRIQADIDAYVVSKSAALRHKLGQNYISKRAQGQEAQHLIEAAEAIAKAVGDYTPEERRQNAALQLRNKGRFAPMNRRIETNTRDTLLNAKEAEKLGVPAAALSMLKEPERKEYQAAYLQVQDLLKELDGMPVKDTLVNYTYKMPNGALETQTFFSADPVVSANKYAQGGRLVEVEVKVANDLSVNGAAFDMASAMTNPQFASWLVGAAPKAGQATRDFSGEWTKTETNDAYSNTNRFYRRLGAASRLIETMLPDSALKTKVAAAFGSWVGEYGPEAEKVLGPGMRKATYRYRGIERTPDADMVSVVENSPRDRVIYPTSKEEAKGQRVISVESESPVIQYFIKRLPKQELYTLQRKSGTIPPSEGIIIDRNGKVITQAVGYGDDWYLPFNLRNLGKLQGGEYIRTRAIGGPTTEDVYAGMISGARRVTVVSRSGVFTVEFDETFRGTRRYSDKAARMVNRYGQLLDAVQAEKITPSTIPGEKIAEFRAQAENLYGDDDQAVKTFIERAMAKELANPRLSENAKAAIKQEVLADAAAKVTTADGMPMRTDDYLRYVAGRSVARDLQEMGVQIDKEGAAAERNKRFTVMRNRPDVALAEAGLSEEAATRIDREEAKYRASLRPLRLDGQGYAFALEALREQFPYYIKRVVERPVSDIGGVAQGTNSKDYGYIKPRFNRPEGVEVGYYDATITGRGKLSGDKVNYQNFGVMGANTFTVSDDRDNPASARSLTARSTTSSTGDTRMSDAMSAVNLVTHFRSLTTKPGATFEGKELPVGSLIADSEKIQTLYPTLFKTPVDEVRAAMADPTSGIRARLEKEIDGFRSNFGNTVDIDAKVLAEFSGKQVQVKKFDVIAALLDPNGEYDFDDSSFDPNRTPEQYKARYDGPGPMANVRRDLGLGEITDSANMGKIDAKLADFAKLRDAQDKWERYTSKTTPAPIRDLGMFNTNVKNVMQVKTLIRRYETETLNRALQPTPVLDSGTATQVVIVQPDGKYTVASQADAGQPVTVEEVSGTALDVLQRLSDPWDKKYGN